VVAASLSYPMLHFSILRYSEVDLHTVKKCVNQANKVGTPMLEALENSVGSKQFDLFARLNEKF